MADGYWHERVMRSLAGVNAQNAYADTTGMAAMKAARELRSRLEQDYAKPLAGRNNNSAREMTPEDIGLRGYSFWLGADHG